MPDAGLPFLFAQIDGLEEMRTASSDRSETAQRMTKISHARAIDLLTALRERVTAEIIKKRHGNEHQP